MACALTAVGVKDFVRHETYRLKVEDRANDVGDLTHMAERVQCVELRMCFACIHWRLDNPQCDRIHPDTALRIPDREGLGRGI